MKQYLLFDLDGTLTVRDGGHYLLRSVCSGKVRDSCKVLKRSDSIYRAAALIAVSFRSFMDFLKKMPGRQWNITESILHQRESLRMRYIREFQKC